jgi:Holliday junction resolvase
LPYLYSLSKFGRDAELVVAIYLQHHGWNVWLSAGSRGPADIIATRSSSKWLVQVKSSNKIPVLKGREVNQLKDMAKTADGLPVVATLQPREAVVETLRPKGKVDNRSRRTSELLALSNYGIFLYSLIDWKRVCP